MIELVKRNIFFYRIKRISENIGIESEICNKVRRLKVLFCCVLGNLNIGWVI